MHAHTDTHIHTHTHIHACARTHTTTHTQWSQKTSVLTPKCRIHRGEGPNLNNVLKVSYPNPQKFPLLVSHHIPPDPCPRSKQVIVLVQKAAQRNVNKAMRCKKHKYSVTLPTLKWSLQRKNPFLNNFILPPQKRCMLDRSVHQPTQWTVANISHLSVTHLGGHAHLWCH